MIDFDRLEKLSKKATPGPWEDVGAAKIRRKHDFVADCAPIVIYGMKSFLKYKANADYILAACNSMPEIIEYVRDISSRTGICVSRLSALERGIEEPTEQERSILAKTMQSENGAN